MNTREVLDALDYMQDFVETYDSALGVCSSDAAQEMSSTLNLHFCAGWIQAGGADLVLGLLGTPNSDVFVKTCEFLATLLQNHIPVQKALFHSPLGVALWNCFAGILDSKGNLLNPSFQSPQVELEPVDGSVSSAAAVEPAAAAAGHAGEHAAWREQNTAARTSTAHSQEEAAAAVSNATVQWGALSVGAVGELTALLSALSCLTRAADIIEQFFVGAQGVHTLGALWCHTPQEASTLKLRRKLAVFIKAMLMRAPLRSQVAAALLEQPAFLQASAGVLSTCVQDGQIHEVDLLENTLFILQHLAVHAAVTAQAGGGAPPSAADVPSLQEALAALLACLPTQSTSSKQIMAISKALSSAFAE